MNRTQQILMPFLLALLMLITVNLSYATPASDLSQILSGIGSIQANFNQQVITSKGRVIQQTSGKMSIMRPYKFRWETFSPRDELIVANGSSIWFYNKNLKQATVSTQRSKITSTPAAILSGDSKGFLRNFFTNYRDGWYVLQPKGGQFKYIYLRFNGSNIQTMQLQDQYGKKAIINFSNVRVNANLSSSLFNFTPPSGTDIIRK